MSRIKRVLSLSSVLALSVYVWGCDSGKDGGAGDNILSFEDLPETGEEDRAASQGKADEAQAEMERVLSGIYDADEIELEEIDFKEADRLYQEAIAADPRNTEAQFGAAIAHLLALSSNEVIQAVQDSVGAFGDNEEFGLMGGGNGAEAVAKLPLIPAKMTLSALEDPLTVSNIQKAIDEEIIPAIDFALDRLAVVEGDLEFKFILTSEMQGDEEGEALEIDLGEAYMLDAQLRLTKATLLVATAYDFDFDENGSHEFLEDDSDENVLRHMVRLDKTSSFMTLKSAGKMQNAKDEILTAIAKMEGGLAFIRQETDDQEDDIIRREDVTDLDAEMDFSGVDEDVPVFFREIRTTDDALRKAREILEGTVEIEADFDGDEGTPKAKVVFDVGKFFDEPVADLRQLLPYREWHPELLGNRNFADELVLTDAEGNVLGAVPPVVFPDPSLGGIFSNISTNQEVLDLFGIEAENLNEADLLYEVGILHYRDGGIIVTNNTSAAVEVIYTAFIGDEFTENHRVSVAAGTQELDVVRSEFGKAIGGDEFYSLSILMGGNQVFEDRDYIFGNIFVTVGAREIIIEEADHETFYDDPENPYVSRSISLNSGQ